MQEQAVAVASFKQMLQIQEIVVEAVSSVAISSERAEEIIESESSVKSIIAAILGGKSQFNQYSRTGKEAKGKSKEEVRGLLFIEPFADDGRPLFKTQRQMAQAIVAHTESPLYGKMAENVRIFIGQILKERHESGARPISVNMEITIPLVIADRIADTDKAKEVSNTIIKAIKEL